ncbi:MAG: lipocalin family protein [Sphingomonadales bacterium]|nr:lipocalin family protein [Sphingomonadales bacterium]MDE2168149.1 lipocalin family protein [Sphingomonadales bacterium]
MRRKLLTFGVIGAATLIGACAAIPHGGPVGNKAVPQPAEPVDLERYMGRWHEQFRYEASFEKDMDAVTADYSLHGDGTVRVVNRGRKPDGRWKQSVGVARIADPVTRAKLKVSFFRPFYGDYWVLDHGADYDWSIVGEPSGRYLWVLTRDSHPRAAMLTMLQARVRSLGYDWSLVRVTKQ